MNNDNGFRFKVLAKKILISLAIGFAVLTALALFLTDHGFMQVLTCFSLRTLLIVLGLCIGNYLLRFLKWHFFLYQLKIKVHLKESLLIFLSGLALSPTPARAGELLKSYWLNRYNQTPVSSSAPVVVAEWITDSLSALILAGIGMKVFDFGGGVLEVVAILLLALLLTLQFKPFAMWLLSFLERIKLLKRFSARLSYIYQTAAQLLSFKNLMISTLISLGSWSLEVFALVYLLHSINVPINFSAAAFVFCFATIVGILTMIPGGLAVVEGGMVGLLLLLQVPNNEAVFSTIVIRTGTLWLGVLMGIICLGFLFNRYFGCSVLGMKNDIKLTEDNQGE